MTDGPSFKTGQIRNQAILEGLKVLSKLLGERDCLPLIRHMVPKSFKPIVPIIGVDTVCYILYHFDRVFTGCGII